MIICIKCVILINYLEGRLALADPMKSKKKMNLKMTPVIFKVKTFRFKILKMMNQKLNKVRELNIKEVKMPNTDSILLDNVRNLQKIRASNLSIHKLIKMRMKMNH